MARWYYREDLKFLIRELPKANGAITLRGLSSFAAKDLQNVDDLSFPPPFDEQAKYLKLADDFLARTTSEQLPINEKVQSIDVGRCVDNKKSNRAA